ncbi:MAG: DegV family protein [Lachnospiraceae bacterium]|nr:DegV family protein [Lachnospiraceae bacterium]
MVKFIADSAADLREYPGICFESVPLTLSTSERTFTDDKKLNVHDMLEYLYSHKGRSFTACPSTQAWMDAFEGADEIYVVTITSGLSGTYNSACVAKEQYISEHPDTKICVVDSLSTGPGEVLILEKLVEMKNEGKSFEEISGSIEQYRDSLRLHFGLKSLHNLAQNGRVSKIIASAIGIMNIRILGTASKEGTIEQVARCRGERKLIDTILEEIKKIGYKGGKVRICHVENAELASYIIEGIKREFGKIDIKSILAGGLCSFYAERGGIIIGCECTR